MSPLIPASPLAFGGSFRVDRKQLDPEEPLSHLHPGSCFGGLAVLNITSFSAVVSLQRLQVSGRTHIYWGIPFESSHDLSVPLRTPDLCVSRHGVVPTRVRFEVPCKLGEILLYLTLW